MRVRSAILVVRRAFGAMQMQQCRFYQPPKLHRRELDNIQRRTKPFVPKADHPFTQKWQLKPEIQKDYKREAYAKYGSASGVSLDEILPTKKEIQEEWEAEEYWWPTLKEMQDSIQKKNEEKMREKAEYEKRVAENMAKMPKWIEQWEKEQKKEQERLAQQELKRSNMVEKAMEELNYRLDPESKEFKDYLMQMREAERKEKKKSKKLAKQR